MYRFSNFVDSYLQLNYNLNVCNICHIRSLITMLTDFANSNGALRSKTKFNFCLYCKLLGHKLQWFWFEPTYVPHTRICLLIPHGLCMVQFPFLCKGGNIWENASYLLHHDYHSAVAREILVPSLLSVCFSTVHLALQSKL